MLWLFQSLHVYNSKATRVHLQKLDLPNWQSMSSTVNTVKITKQKLIVLSCLGFFYYYVFYITVESWISLGIYCILSQLFYLLFCFFSQVNMSYFLLIEWQVLYTRRLTQKAKKYHDGFLRLAIYGSLGMQVDFRTIVFLVSR